MGRISAFVLVCFRLLTEVGLFVFALGFFIVMFGSGVSALDQDDKDFAGIHLSGLALMKIAFGMFGGSHYDALDKDPALEVAVVVYIICANIFLANLLIAQLSCAYQATYQDMVGFARLNRGKIVTETMISVSRKRWEKFVNVLHLEEPCEFGEGDIGLAGGIQLLEPAALNITTVDMIRRFGGSTSPAAQWPEEDQAGDDEEDRFERMERLIEKAMKRMTSAGGKKKGGGAGGGSSVGQGSSDQGNEASGSAHESEHESE